MGRKRCRHQLRGTADGSLWITLIPVPEGVWTKCIRIIHKYFPWDRRAKGCGFLLSWIEVERLSGEELPGG